MTKVLSDHTFDTDQRCRDGLKGYDALIVTGTDLARSQDIPPADALAAALNKKTLARLITVKHSDFTRELAKREILSDQYESDIQEGARVGFGALAFSSTAKVGCTVVEEDLAAHDQTIDAVLLALQFLNGAAIKKTTNVSVDVAFRQTQKGRCAFIYGSGQILKTILDASAGAGLAPTVLPVEVRLDTETNDHHLKITFKMGLVGDGIEYADPNDRGAGYTVIEGDTDAPLILPYAQTQRMHKDARTSGRWDEEVKKNCQVGERSEDRVPLATYYPPTTSKHHGGINRSGLVLARWMIEAQRGIMGRMNSIHQGAP